MHACRLGGTLQSMNGPSWCHRDRPEASIANCGISQIPVFCHVSHAAQHTVRQRVTGRTVHCARSTGAPPQLPGRMPVPRWTSAPRRPSQIPRAAQPPREPWSASAPLSAPPAGHQTRTCIHCRALYDGRGLQQHGADAVTLPLRSHAQILMQDHPCHEWRARERQNRGTSSDLLLRVRDT